MPWTPNLSVGVPQIDEQHKVWFEKAEKLFEAGQKRQAAGYIGELLGFLDDYTRQHFADEEKYMLSINYPEYAAQKQAHTAFIAELEKIKREFESSGGSFLVIMNANKLVIDWLTKHISNMDKKIGEYAKQQKS
jgi:hemerythrin